MRESERASERDRERERYCACVYGLCVWVCVCCEDDYLMLPTLLFLSCSSLRVMICCWAIDICSSMLVISSLARRLFSYTHTHTRKRKESEVEMYEVSLEL